MIEGINKTKLTKWANEPTFSDLNADLDMASDSLEEYRAKLAEYARGVEGGKKVKARPGKSTVRPKLIEKQGEWKIPALEEPFLNTVDMFDITGRTSEDVEAARLNALYLNWQWATKVDKTELIGNVVRTLVYEGTAIVKTGWEAEYETQLVEVEQPVYASPEESMMLMDQAVASGSMSPEEAQAMLETGEPVQTGVEIVQEEQEVLIVNKPTYELCANSNVGIDPTCDGVLRDAKFIWHEYETNMSELKKNEYRVDKETGEEFGVYKNLDRIRVDGDDDDYDELRTDASNNFRFGDAPRKRLTAYEYWGYWDIEGKGELTSIVATWVNGTIIRMEENPYAHGRLPFSIATYIPVLKDVRGKPDGAILIDNQDSIGRLTRAAHDITAAQAVGQLFIDDQLLSPQQKTNLDKGNTTYYRTGMDINKSMQRQSVDSVPSTVFQMIDMQNNEAEALSGVKAFSNGISGASLGSTATGAKSAMDSTAKREMSILRRLSNSLFKDIAILTVSMNQEFAREEEVIRVTNGSFHKISKDALAGEMDLKVDVSTPEKDAETAADLGMVLQTGASVMDPMMVNKVWAKILDLKNHPDLAEEFRQAKPPEPSPQQQEMEQLQIENARLEKKKLEMDILLKAKEIESYDSIISERQSRTAENEGDRENKVAEAELRRAQAEKLRSETDMLDKEFLEGDQAKEDDHYREMEKMKFSSDVNRKGDS